MFTLSAATLIPVLSAFFAAIAGVMARTLLKGVPAKRILSINFFTMAAVLLILSPAFYFFEFSWLAFGLLILIAAIDTAANFFYFKTFEQTEASVAVPILSLAPVVTFIVSALLLGEKPSALTFLMALAIIGLVIVVSTDWKAKAEFRAATLYPAIISSVLFGISAIPSKYLLSTLEAVNAPTLYMIRAALIALFATLLFMQPLVGLEVKTYRFIFFRGLFVIAQYILLYYALTLGSTGVAVTLGNITPVFVLILSYFFLREKADWKRVVAALAILVISFNI